MSDSRMERKKKKTREKIITAAIKLFDQHGIEGTTMEEIAETADIARGTLYNYFSSKEAVIYEYVERTFQIKQSVRFDKLAQIPDTRSRIIFIFTELIQGVMRQKDLFEKYIIYRMQGVISFQNIERKESGFYLLVHKIIASGQKLGEIRTDLPQSLVEDLFEFTFIESVKPLYLNPEKYDLKTEVEHCVDIFMNGAGT